MTQKINEIEDPKAKYYEPKPEGEKKFWKQHIIQKHTKLQKPSENDAVFDGSNVKKDKTRKADKSDNTGTMSEMTKRDEVVEAMKKKQSSFQEKYGSRWKDVMYASAMKEDSQAASSDNPGQGGPTTGGSVDKSHADMGNVSPEKQANNESKDVLEKIAMQAAELHDSLDDKTLDSDTQRKLNDIKDSLEEVYEAVTNGTNDGASDGNDSDSNDNNVKEDYEQIDELSKDTLKSYARKASVDASHRESDASLYKHGYSGMDDRKAEVEKGQKLQAKANKRWDGVDKATAKAKLAKEESELEEGIPMGHRGIKPVEKDKGKSVSFSKVKGADAFKAALERARAKKAETNEEADPKVIKAHADRISGIDRAAADANAAFKKISPQKHSVKSFAKTFPSSAPTIRGDQN